MKESTTTKRAERITTLLNSVGVAYSRGVDQLNDPTSAAKLVKLFAPDVPKDGTTDRMIEALRAVRQSLLEVVTHPSSRSGWASLNSVSKEVQFSLALRHNEVPELVCVSGCPVVAGVLRDVESLMSSGSWDRVKICANEYCLTAFFDTTKSKTQRWDSYASCGNRTNVAAFRSRQK